MDEQRNDAEQPAGNRDDAQQDERLRDLDVTEEQGQSITGGVPKQPDPSVFDR
jgi:hypothetical protein